MPQSDFWPFNKSIRSIEDVDVNGEPSVLQKQLGDMEGEVKEIQMELAAIKKDRRDLVSRKQAKVYSPVAEFEDIVKEHNTCDFVPRFPEIYKLREELIRAKNAADEERIQREKYEGKLKELELKLNDICTGEIATEAKDSRYSNEEMSSLKIQNRDLKEEIEELKITLNEKTEQLQDYRMRYLQAQQQVEEAKRQRDVIEFDNKQVSDQIQLEIQKMKMQFQEKLQELAPLPDLLKGAQIQLQEAKQLQKLAEDSSQQLSGELHRVKEKLVMAVNSLNQEKADKSQVLEENKMIKISLYEKDKEIDVMTKDMDEYKIKVCRLEEKLVQLESRFKEKALECSQLLKDLDELRGESARTLARCKDRAEAMRRHTQNQISELERQLIQSRAQCRACQKERDDYGRSWKDLKKPTRRTQHRACQKDGATQINDLKKVLDKPTRCVKRRACQKERDDIRQRLQLQINSLQENFELVEIRLRALQNQVASLKNTYSVILTDEDEFNKITSS